MAILSKVATKTLCLISLTSLASTATISSAIAGPAVAFRGNRFKMNQSECIQKGTDILRSNSLPNPSNGETINNTPVVFGENAEITAIVDCSEVSQSGRVTVMVGHQDSTDEAFYWAGFLLRQF